ncbi:MAG: hypothetical protein D6723_16325 [Acidobacteria bacterium]|nr:MAG: hypothetical protein D6723_16325 [Acidobacteriota bacterium]
MTWRTKLLIVIVFIGGCLLPHSLPAIGQEAPRYLALVAASGNRSAPGTGDVTLLTVTPDEGTILGSIPTTGRTVELAVAPDGRYALAINQSGTASLITGLDTPQPMEERLLPAGLGATGVAITPDGSTAVILSSGQNPPMATIIDGLPDAPTVRTTLPIPGAIPGSELDIAIFPSGDTAAIGAGCGGLSLLDGLLSGPAAFRPGSPLDFVGCVQGLAVAPDEARIYTASLLSGQGFAVLTVEGVQPGEQPFLAGMSAIQSSTFSNLRQTPDGSRLLVPGFKGLFIYREMDASIDLLTLLPVGPRSRAARQGGLALSPDGRLALLANIDTGGRTTLSIISDVLTEAPEETARLESSEMVNTLEGAQQSIAFVPLVMPPALFREQEPNDDPQQANAIVPDVTVIGVFDPAGDEDYFSFDAQGGERLIVETRAQRLDPPSAADTVVAVVDGEGHVLAENDDAGTTFDSRVEVVLPAPGRYFIRLRESRNKGGPNFNYEATISLSAPR